MIDNVAVARKHIKFELPRLSKFSRIAAHLRAWLVRIHEHLITIGVEQNVWVVFAAFYLLGCVPCLIGCVPCLIGCVPSTSWLCAPQLAVCHTLKLCAMQSGCVPTLL